MRGKEDSEGNNDGDSGVHSSEGYLRFLTTRSPGAAVCWGASRPFSLMWPDELAETSPLCVGSMASDIVACVVAVPTSSEQ